MRAAIEFMPLMWPSTPAEAAAFLTDSGAHGAGLVLDAMHVFRSGASAADIAVITTWIDGGAIYGTAAPATADMAAAADMTAD